MIKAVVVNHKIPFCMSDVDNFIFQGFMVIDYLLTRKYHKNEAKCGYHANCHKIGIAFSLCPHSFN